MKGKLCVNGQSYQFTLNDPQLSTITTDYPTYIYYFIITFRSLPDFSISEISAINSHKFSIKLI